MPSADGGSSVSWVRLSRIQFAMACNPPTDAGRVPLPARLLRHAALLHVGFPTDASLRQIYAAFARAVLRPHPPLRPYADALAEASLDVYSAAQRAAAAAGDARPAWYVYSPRELSRWMRAIHAALTDGEAAGDLSDLVRLWAHEGARLFHDRLVTDSERQAQLKTLEAAAARHFVGVPRLSLAQPLLFSAWLGGGYTPCDAARLRSFLVPKLQAFSDEEVGSPLVLFDDMAEHALRIARVLKQPMGHVLLVGTSGAGKTTLARFVAWLEGLSVFEVKASRSYSAARFADDLRNLLRRAGVRKERVAFVFDEANAVEPAFLEQMNALLASGEVPALFEGDEMAALMQQCREAAQAAGDGARTEAQLWSTFVANVQRHLHVIFTMNPSGVDWKNRSATSPALFNRCVVDVVGDWSAAALQQVADQLTRPMALGMPLDADGAEEHTAAVRRASLAHLCARRRRRGGGGHAAGAGARSRRGACCGRAA